MSGEMFGGDVMLALPGRTVHHGDLILFGPGSQTAAESPRHAHQMIVVQVVIGTVQRTPPRPQPSARLPHCEICVQDHTVDAIITALEKIVVEGAQLIRHAYGASPRPSATATVYCKLPRRGHFFGAESPKKRSYDCVDRVILNAYFTMGQSGGGLRTWWRALYGSDNNLDDNHLMRMAGRFSRRLRAWAKENEIPVVYSSPGERKHDIASEHLATHEVKPGLFRILVSKAPALVWEAPRTATGKLGPLVPKQPWPYVNHYSFHILDPDWGHLTIKMSGHPPFGAQVMLNGHEYVAC